MASSNWHPRGEPTWPNFKEAVPGVTRVRHARSGATGTFARWPSCDRKRNPGYAVVDWDNGARGRVVAYAFDLEAV